MANLRGWLLVVAILVPACSAERDGAPGATGLGPSGPARPFQPVAVLKSECAHYPADLIQWVDGSGAIFVGTVTQLHATTPDWGSAPGWDLDRAVVVRLEQAYVQPRPGTLLPGSDGTILLAAPPGMPVGYRGIFFVTAQAAGRSWVWNEVAHVAAADYPAMESMVQTIQRYLEDAALYARLASADAIVMASVDGDQTLPGPPGGPVSEHSPEWHEAMVSVRDWLRAPSPVLSALPVRFDASWDVARAALPKLYVGNQGLILLLHADTVTGVPGTAYVVTDPLDVHLASAEARLSRLLVSPPLPPEL